MSSLKRLRRIAEAATPGPWAFRNNLGCKAIGQRVNRQTLDPVAHTPGRQDEGEDRANARLIVDMRNALPALLDVAEAAREVSAHLDTDAHGCLYCGFTGVHFEACPFTRLRDALRGLRDDDENEAFSEASDG